MGVNFYKLMKLKINGNMIDTVNWKRTNKTYNFDDIIQIKNLEAKLYFTS